MGLFVHFGINTFADLEWSDGTCSPRLFAPSALNADQWAAAAKLAGMRYLVITAKHHDGFCLWQTATTDYSVAGSPWQDGQGDVIAEVADACRRQGIKLGLYCSPWDRHEPCYADEPAYDRFYMMQWIELLSRYGDVCEVWFDGAGSQDHHFDWPAIYKVVRHYQPHAVCFNGPDVRWVGNEDGLAPDPCWNAIEDDHGRLVYRPAECDVPLRTGWFWHPDNESTRKSPAHLWDIYHRSVGHGANLLLNVGPDRRGLLPETDVAAIVNLHRALQRAYGKDLLAGGEVVTSGDFGREPRNGGRNVADGDPRTRWLADAETAWVEVALPHPAEIDRVVLQEWLPEGERVRRWRLFADGDRLLAAGESIGHKKIVRFEPVTAHRVRLEIVESVAPPAIRAVQAYRGFDPERSAG